MISFDKKVFNLLNDAPYHSAIKIFLFIALNQPPEGLHGLISTKEQLAGTLNLKRSAIFRDLKWLKDNLLIQELKLLDCSDFMVNPYFVMNNSNRDERIKEWNRRCNLDSAREVRLRKERRIRKLRIEKK